MISAGQIKAARAILDWSQDQMAVKAGLSPTTIHNLEKSRNLEKCQVALRSVLEVRKACEKHGLEFIDGDGVRRRMEEIKVYAGHDSCDRFFDDMLQTAQERDDEIVTVSRSQEMLCQSLGDEGITDPKRLRQLAEVTEVKCLLSETHPISFSMDTCQFRVSPKYHVGAASYFVCGDKYAVILSEDKSTFRFVVFKSMSMAQSARHGFLPLWHGAAPFVIQSLARERGRSI
jgi:DNA-binding XRE family transcriptional regulator